MESIVAEEQFMKAMRELTNLHATSIRFRRTRDAAERAFADGLRLGDLVRRAVRQGQRDRPGPSDVTALSQIVARLRGSALDPLADHDLIGLSRDLAAGDLGATAEHACRLFAGLAPEADPPTHVYAPLALRRRDRGGESFFPPEEIAARAIERIARGLASIEHETGAAVPATAAAKVPEPLILSDSLLASGAAVGVRTRARDLAAPLLRHADSGDLWVFRARLPGPFAVAATSSVDDEWWAASPVPYPLYLSRLGEVLREHGTELILEGPGEP